jgi:hypothetical protein
MDRTLLIGTVCRRILDEVGSFGYADTGERVSWLVLAIAEDKKVELDHDAPFLYLLRRLFDTAHSVWRYVHVEQTVLCSICGCEIPVHDAKFVNVYDGWAHPVTCK